MLHDPSCLLFEVVNDILVLNFEHYAFRKYVAPMIHQRVVSATITSQLSEVIGLFHPARPQY